MLTIADPDRQAILGVLASGKVVTSAELQVATGRSQASVSRMLAFLPAEVVTLGRGKSTRYGLPKSIHGRSAQQPVFWIDEQGAARQIAVLSLLAGNWVHVEGQAPPGRSLESLAQGTLPWFLSPLRPQGFLGRVLAQRLAPNGLDSNPDRWDLESVLFAAINLHDAPGAIVIGDLHPASTHSLLPDDENAWALALDALSSDVASTLPVGSSAGGEQPKFTAQLESGDHVLVKFTPPRGTPFGERWHDLLIAEALACEVLSAHGVDVATCHTVHSDRRTYLVSRRFDRIGATGRRHVVSIGAVHEAFVAGRYSNWAQTAHALLRQQRLGRIAADQVRALLAFGRLIGNTDMHSGNLGLLVTQDDLPRGRFKLAPVYDMLPMRWRPDATLGAAPDYAPFDLDAASLASGARVPALDYWSRLAGESRVGKPLRIVAWEMAARLGE
ncbi:MAG: hypothetical protein JWQ11_955 [Rhizobacter sp.]|nr:hypothetical protein [Rhizobacter sp.]